MGFQNGWRGPDIVADGLVLYLDAGAPNSYRPDFGTTWKDMSGFNNSGSLVNGPIYSSANGGSIVFDGVDDNILINNPSTIRNQDFTVSVWVNPEVQNAGIISIVDFDHPAGGWVLQSEDATSNRNYYFAWSDGSTFQPVGGFGGGQGIQVTTAVWQNITYSKSGTLLLGYKNGSQLYSSTATNGNTNYTPNRNLQIGGCVSVVGRNFKGNIPITRIYNRALSASEILQNYNAQKSRFGL